MPRPFLWYGKILQRSVDADQVLGESTQNFINRHIADPAIAAPKAPTSPVNLADELKSNFEKRPPASSVQRGPTHQVKRRPGDVDR
jgi:hypothetical protein